MGRPGPEPGTVSRRWMERDIHHFAGALRYPTQNRTIFPPELPQASGDISLEVRHIFRPAGIIPLQHSDMGEKIGVLKVLCAGGTAPYTCPALDADSRRLHGLRVDAAHWTETGASAASGAFFGVCYRLCFQKLSGCSVFLQRGIVGADFAAVDLQRFRRHSSSQLFHQPGGEVPHLGSVLRIGTAFADVIRESMPSSKGGGSDGKESAALQQQDQFPHRLAGTPVPKDTNENDGRFAAAQNPGAVVLQQLIGQPPRVHGGGDQYQIMIVKTACTLSVFREVKIVEDGFQFKPVGQFSGNQSGKYAAFSTTFKPSLTATPARATISFPGIGHRWIEPRPSVPATRMKLEN